MNRIDRLVAILTTLQSKKFVTAEFIADKYGISVRTVYRDIKALGEIGVPVSFEAQKGYNILQGYFLPPVSFTSEEANALVLMGTLAEKFADKSIKRNSESALNKLTAVLRGADKDNVNYLHSQIKVYQPAEEKNDSYFLSEIQNAIINKHILKIEYINNNEEKSQRQIEPIGLTFYTNQWHLIAWCWERKTYRDFKVLKISSLVNTDKDFKKTDHYDINEYIKSLH